MAYGTVLGVAARVPGAQLGAISTPDTEQVTAWLGQGSAYIDRKLATAGYVAPVADTSALYPELTALAEQYAAAQMLRARGLDTITGEGEIRSEVWLNDVRARINEIAASDLVALGVARAVVSGAPTRMRSVQLRRVDGYARNGGATEYAE